MYFKTVIVQKGISQLYMRECSSEWAYNERSVTQKIIRLIISISYKINAIIEQGYCLYI